MKKSWSILFIGLFLVTSLYSAQILQGTYASSATPTEPNMTKDFAPSTDYTSSPQSITSFAETLPNNVLFYPDGTQLEKDESPTDGGIYYFEAGDLSGTCYLAVTSDFDGDYDALILNGDGLNGMDTGGGVVSNDGFPLRFNLNVTISSYSEGAGSEMYLRLVAFSGIGLGGVENYFVREDIDGNGDLIIDAECGLSSVGSMLVMVDFSGFSVGDTVNVTLNSYYFYTMSGSGYVENFADVSDWAFDVASGTYSFTSDGDIGTLVGECVGAGNDYVRYDQYGLNIPKESYVEFRYKTVDAKLRIQFFDGDTEEPEPCYEIYSVDWTTVKFYLGAYVDADVTGIELQINDFSNTKDSGNIYAYFDYFRIGPSNEMGWQHDGSTMGGITEYSGDVSSDGYTISVIGNGESGCGIFWVDATTNKSAIESIYYPFLAIDITNIDATDWSLGYATTDTPTTWYDFSWFLADETDSGVFRININSLGIDPSNIAVLSQGGTVEVDYIKAYSIANFSYDDGGSESINDYSYIEDGKFVIHTDTYTKWNHDPTLSVTIATYPIWNTTIQGDDSGFRFRELADTNTLWSQGITNGTLVGTTLTDFDMLIYSNCIISAISFFGIGPQWTVIDSIELVFDTKGWYTIDTIILYFYIEISTYALNLIFLFLGLAMIPTSTIFLVKGGRDEMSTDKLLVVILCFFMGWALFLGGIFG